MSADSLNRSTAIRPAAAVLIVVLAAWTPSAASAQAPDVTLHLERLGNPGKITYEQDDKTFARNVWALKTFGGRLYVGIGNRDNFGPAPNAGPVDIWSFEPASKRFVKEWTAPDEQVEAFRVIDEQLVVPGNDPMESWQFGNFYRLEKDGWTKYRTIPNGIHNFDMIKFGGVLYAALGTEAGAVVVASDDDGKTWRDYPLLPVVRNFYARAHSFFVINGRLFVSATGLIGARIFVSTKGTFLMMRKSDFFPGLDGRRLLFMHGYTAFRGHGVYIAMERQQQGHPQAVGLFALMDPQNVRALELPVDGQPRAIVVDGGKLFVLTTRRVADGYDHHVFETRDLMEWRAAFRFRTATFARTFEILGGDFYFGLGTGHEEVSPDTGEILRLPAQHALTPAP
jgi:hypothetical protein